MLIRRCPVRRAIPVLPGLMVRMESMELRVQRVILGPRVRRVLTVRRVPRGIRVRLGNRVLTVRREQTEP